MSEHEEIVTCAACGEELGTNEACASCLAEAEDEDELELEDSDGGDEGDDDDEDDDAEAPPAVVSPLTPHHRANRWRCYRVLPNGDMVPLGYGATEQGQPREHFPLPELSVREIRRRWGPGAYRIGWYRWRNDRNQHQTVGPVSDVFLVHARGAARAVAQPPPMPEPAAPRPPMQPPIPEPPRPPPLPDPERPRAVMPAPQPTQQLAGFDPLLVPAFGLVQPEVQAAMALVRMLEDRDERKMARFEQMERLRWEAAQRERDHYHRMTMELVLSSARPQGTPLDAAAVKTIVTEVLDARDAEDDEDEQAQHAELIDAQGNAIVPAGMQPATPHHGQPPTQLEQISQFVMASAGMLEQVRGLVKDVAPMVVQKSPEQASQPQAAE